MIVEVLKGVKRAWQDENCALFGKRPTQPPSRDSSTENEMISASVTLTQPQGTHCQFIATSGTGHHLLLDDAAGNTGAKPIELVAIALAGCAAFDVINILRRKRQQVTGYGVKVKADQTPSPPQVFTQVRIHHIVSGSIFRRRRWKTPFASRRRSTAP